MILITLLLLVGFAVLLPVFIVTGGPLAQTALITVGVTLYHFAMRLFVGTVLDALMKNKADHSHPWFREKAFEKKLYKLLRVRAWSGSLPTYSPEDFDTEKRTVMELIGATCQAELVHEVIMVLSLLPMVLIPFLGGATALILTSIFSMLYDSLFVILQRYNRPRLVRVMRRFGIIPAKGRLS